ncbi:hypothetical protein HGM15179_019291, partial [Zosterops borbonicus]
MSAMASPSRRLQMKTVITCLKSVLLTYTFVFWYAMLLSLIFLIVLVAAIMRFVFRHEIKTNFESNLNLALKDYNMTVDRHSEAIDTIQRMLHCCRVQNYSDWERTEYFSQRDIPWSCCKNQNDCDCSEEDVKDPNKAMLKVFGCKLSSEKSASLAFGDMCFEEQ